MTHAVPGRGSRARPEAVRPGYALWVDAIDWRAAQRIGERIAGSPPDGDVQTGSLEPLAHDFAKRVSAYSGLPVPSELPALETVDRPEWIAANLRTMRPLLGPLGERVGERAGPLAGPLRSATGFLLGAQVGALTGVLSQRPQQRAHRTQVGRDPLRPVNRLQRRQLRGGGQSAVGAHPLGEVVGKGLQGARLHAPIRRRAGNPLSDPLGCTPIDRVHPESVARPNLLPARSSCGSPDRARSRSYP